MSPVSIPLRAGQEVSEAQMGRASNLGCRTHLPCGLLAGPRLVLGGVNQRVGASGLGGRRKGLALGGRDLATLLASWTDLLVLARIRGGLPRVESRLLRHDLLP